MSSASHRRVITSPQDWERFLAWVADMPMPFTIAVAKGKKRTMSQNALLHVWFTEISQHFDDKDPAEVKAECNVIYGVPIMRANDVIYKRFLNRLNLNYEEMSKAFKLGLLPCTRLMTTKQLTEYMEHMRRDYTARGVRLTDPEILKYRDTHGDPA